MEGVFFIMAAAFLLVALLCFSAGVVYAIAHLAAIMIERVGK